MYNSIYNFTLDLHKHNSERIINVYQYDNAVEVYLSFTDGGNPYFFDEEAQAFLYGKRADDKAILHTCEFKSTSKILYRFNASTTAVVGPVDCQIRIYDGYNKLITAPRFTINVEAPTVDENNIGIEDPNLQFQGIASIITSEADRASAELVRVAGEDSRLAAEKERDAAEKLRDQAEKERDAAEKERDAAEGTRDLAENERKAAEIIRDAAEKARKSAWVRYSAYPDGSNYTETWSSGQNYIGVATSHDEPKDKSGYVWGLFKGEKGEKGEPFRIAKVYASVALMEADFSNTAVPEGCFVAIETGNVEDEDNAKLYLKGETGFTFITDLSGATGLRGEKGEKGDPGDIGRITPEAEELILWAFATNGTHGLKYTFYDGYATCSGRDYDTLKETDIQIGSMAKGFPVTKIEAVAFISNTTLTSVTIPDSITELEHSVFHSCWNLTTAVIGDGVTKIGNTAFADCSELKSVTLGKNLKNIGLNAFRNCTKLTDVYFRGTEYQWKYMGIDGGNGYLTDATIHYNYGG